MLPAVPLGAITSAQGLFGVMCLCSSWVSQSAKREKYDAWCFVREDTQLLRVRSTSHLCLHCTGFSSCCLHHLPASIPLSSLCRFTSWLMLHSHYPESCCRLRRCVRLHPLPLSSFISAHSLLLLLLFYISILSLALTLSASHTKKDQPTIWK